MIHTLKRSVYNVLNRHGHIQGYLWNFENNFNEYLKFKDEIKIMED